MSKSNKNPFVIIIVGPTAVGKTELSLRLAERLQGEIISMDSRLIYRGMDIGTAKPTAAERARIPHHMIDLADPDENWSLALFRKHVLLKIDEITRRKKIPILVGGTGQYVRALVEGWVIPPQQPDDRLREVLSEWGQEIGADGLFARLRILDKEAAETIDSRNQRRVVRAIEVILKTGRKFSSQQLKEKPPLDFFMIGLSRPRHELYQRVDERIDKMFELGFVEEVRSLMQKGYGEQNPPLSAIGYREVIKALKDEMTIEEAKTEVKRKTREFIRRQANWFKTGDDRIHWYEMTPDPLETILNDLRIANVLPAGDKNKREL